MEEDAVLRPDGLVWLELPADVRVQAVQERVRDSCLRIRDGGYEGVGTRMEGADEAGGDVLVGDPEEVQPRIAVVREILVVVVPGSEEVLAPGTSCRVGVPVRG